MKRNRVKTMNIAIGNEVLHSLIFKPVTDSMVDIIRFKGNKLPPIKELRKSLEPAYEIIAVILTEVLKNNIIKPEQLSALSINLLPTCGYYVIHVTYMNDQKIQPYKLTVKPLDRKSLVMRYATTPVFDASLNKTEEIMKMISTL